MSLFKCKMCGGELNITEGMTVCECEYCGTKQTVPNADNEKKMNLFARANRLRFSCEFDKAYSIYETIVEEFPEEAEAYWGLILCKYGIEYVDDPATAKKIPTCHRSSYDSVLEDPNFEMVMENSDTLARSIYREEAKQIETIRNGIIEVSSKEAPYDIFICYKETDENGGRTLDSVLAQDIYDALTEKGYKVFFSRISLEDKLGQEYEPYIFAALHSAKVMLAVGTDYEYYNAVWVKNEWSRYLQLIANGEKKTLIPCYKGIDAYDMPKEFAKLQAQDMGKVGAMQDLLRGVEKIVPLGGKTVAEQPAGSGIDTIVETLMKRASDALAEGEWEQAVRCYDNVLDYDSKNEQAYLGKILVECKAVSLSDVENGYQTISGSKAYQYLLKNGNEKTVQEIKRIEEKIEANIREKKEADKKQKKAKSRKRAKVIFEIIAAVLVIAGAAYLVKTFLIPTMNYKKAEALLEEGQYDAAASAFAALNYKDSSDRVYQAYLQKAESYTENQDYIGAIQVLEENGLFEINYRNCCDLKTEYLYQNAVMILNEGRYQEAMDAFGELQGYKDSDDKLTDIIYMLACEKYESGSYEEAISMFGRISGYLDTDDLVKEAQYKQAEQNYQKGDLDRALEQYAKLGNYHSADEEYIRIALEAAEKEYQNGNTDEAISYYEMVGDYENIPERIQEITYEAGTVNLEAQDYVQAIKYFSAVTEYSDAAVKLNDAKYGYCLSVIDEPTNNAKSYIKQLIDAGYPNAAETQKKMLAWKAKDMRLWPSLRLGSQTGVTFEFVLAGGDGTSTTAKYVVHVDGERLEWTNEKQYKAGDKVSGQVTNNIIDITKKTYTFEVYDQNGNLIVNYTGVPEPENY